MKQMLGLFSTLFKFISKIKRIFITFFITMIGLFSICGSQSVLAYGPRYLDSYDYGPIVSEGPYGSECITLTKPCCRMESCRSGVVLCEPSSRPCDNGAGSCPSEPGPNANPTNNPNHNPSPYTTCRNFEGIYTGLALGGSLRSGRGNATTVISNTFTPSGNTNSQNVSVSFDLRQNAPMLALTLGQGFQFCEYYAGYEFYAAYAKYHRATPIVSSDNKYVVRGGIIEKTFSNTSTSRLNTVELGVDFKPGFIFCESTLMYGRLGLAYNRLHVDVNPISIFNAPVNGDFGKATIDETHTKNRFGWRFGLGLEHRFHPSLSLRMDYAYTFYGNKNVYSKRTVADPNGVVVLNNTTTVKLANNAITLGLIYWW